MQKLIDPTIPREFVSDALQAAECRGVDAMSLVRDAGIDPLIFDRVASRVSVIDYAKLIEKIIAKLDDGFLGFLDDVIPQKAFAVFACQLAACSNLRELVQQANHFYGLFTNQFRFEVIDKQDRSGILLRFQETQDFDYRFIYQSMLLALLRLMHWYLGENIRPLQINFTFSSNNMGPYLDYLYDCPLAYSKPLNELWVERDLLSAPCSTNLDQVSLMLRDSTRMMLISTRTSPYTRRVRKELILNRKNHWPSIEEVATIMSMSKNLLWRKLKKENTRFLDIRDEVKRDFALSIIHDAGNSIADVAAKTGFSELSSFNRAFTKWTGLSPAAYRNGIQLSQ